MSVLNASHVGSIIQIEWMVEDAKLHRWTKNPTGFRRSVFRIFSVLHAIACKESKITI